MGSDDIIFSKSVCIPKIKLRLRAGVSDFQTEPDMTNDGYEQMPQAVLSALDLDVRTLLAMRVRDRGMEPMMFEDDVVIFDTSDRRPVSREVYALNFDGEPCVAQLISRGGQWYISPINKELGQVNMRSGNCSVIGRVVYQPGRVLIGRM